MTTFEGSSASKMELQKWNYRKVTIGFFSHHWELDLGGKTLRDSLG